MEELMIQEEQAVTEKQEVSNKPIAIGFQNINQGTVAIEASRAIAEAQSKLAIAKQFPRDEITAYAKMMESCRRPTMAKSALYSFPRGGKSVDGISIRLAEEMARCWGNLDYGIKELSRDNGKSEMQAYAWDLETNTISSQNFTVMHQREVNKKMQTLTSERDIYENNANQGARRVRSRILAILPNWFVSDALAEINKTLAGDSDVPLIDRVKKMVDAFGKMGVSKDQIEGRLKRKVETMTIDDLTEYTKIYNGLRQGETKASDWFGGKESNDLTNALKEEKKVNA